MAAPLGTALITGASSGIGEIYADRLARRGYDLVLVGRNVDKLSALKESLAAATGRHVERIAADLGSAADLARVEQRLASDAAISLLVNSAGLTGAGPLSAGNLDTLTEMLEVNVVALTRLTSVAAKAFSARGKGAIVNLASAMAFIAGSQTIIFASALASTFFSSGTVKNGFTGATWAPALITASSATSISIVFGIRSTTRSPLPTPAARKCRASPFTARPSSR